MEYGQRCWDMLWQAGEPEGMVPGGYRAIDTLRLEKGYRYWSSDHGPDYTPYEAGLGFAVRLNKQADFIGKQALVAQKEQGLTRKLCCLSIADPAAVMVGKEPIFNGEEVVGWTTSGAYGYSVGKSITYAYLPIALSDPGTQFDVLFFGEKLKAVVEKEPLWDPKNERIKA
jgi:4-methylaminobutanoate oxidase (formaldehyde-forming)